MTTPGRFAREEDGSSLVEFSLTATVLFTFIFCLMEALLAFYSYDRISECVREGTRYAMVRGTSCTTTASSSCTVTTSQVNSYVSGLAWPNLAGGTMTVTTSWQPSSSCSSPTPATCSVLVSVQYVFPVKMPFVPKSSITMTSTSESTIIQ